MRSGDKPKPPVLLLRDPGNDRAVVEAHDELHAHGDVALKPADDAHDVAGAFAPAP